MYTLSRVGIYARVSTIVGALPALFLVMFFGTSTSATAQTTYTWTGATDPGWGTATNWFGGVSPGLAIDDIVQFDMNSTLNLGTTLGAASVSIGQVVVIDPSAPVSIGGTGTLTLNASTGFDLSAATQNLTVTAPLSIAFTGAQTWNVGTGRILSVGATALGATTTGLTFNGAGATTFTAATTTAAAATFLNSGTGLVTFAAINSTNFGVTFDGSGNFNAGGIIALGTGGVTKSGNGTLTLGGVNTYSGGTVINGGIVSIAADSGLGVVAGGVTLNGGQLNMTAATTVTNGARVFTIGAGGGTINITTATQYFFNTANTLTGSGTLTIIGGGTFANTTIGNFRTNVANSFSGNIILQNGASFEYGNAAAVAAGATFTLNGGGGTLAELAASAVTVSNAITVNGGTLSFANGNTGIFSGSITIGASGLVVGMRDWFSTFAARNGTISGALIGSANTTIIATTGTAAVTSLTLSGNNASYTGGFSVAPTVNLVFSSLAARGGSGTITLNTSNTQLSGVAFGYDFAATIPTITNVRTGGATTGGVFAINTTLASTTTVDLSTLGGGGMFLGSQGTGTYAASTLGADGTNYRLGGSGGTLTLSSAVLANNGGTTALIVNDTRLNGGGTVILGANATYTGTTTINAGTLQVGNGGTTGSIGSGAVSIGAATLAIRRTDNITIANVITASAASATLAINGGAVVTLSAVGNTLGAISFNTVANGTLDIGANNTIIGQSGAGGALITANVSGTINATGGGQLRLNSNNGDIGAAAGVTLTINAVIANGTGSAIDFFNAGFGTVVLTGANLYTGVNNFQGGTVSVTTVGNVSATSNLGSQTTVANATLNFGNGANSGTLRYTGIGETSNRVLNLAGTTGSGTIDQSGTGLLKFTSNLTATGAGIKSLTLTGSTAGTGELSGAIVNNSGTNTTALIKTGTGTWTLSGTNTYTGATTVSNGTLVLSGSITSSVVVNNAVQPAAAVFTQTSTGVISGANTFALTAGNATLAGANTYTGLTTVGAGTLTITGSLAATPVTFNNTGTFLYTSPSAGGALSLGALNFTFGEGTVQSTYGTSGNTSITFSALGTRTAGANANFITTGGANGTTNRITLTGVTANTFVNNGFYFNSGAFAWNDTSGFLRAIVYGTDTGAVTSAGGTTIATTTHQQITGSLTAQTTATFTTLNISGASNITIAAANTLTVGSILKSGTGTSATISGGTALSNVSGADYLIRVDGAATDTLTISSVIAGVGTNAIVKSGPGTLVLSGANTFIGDIYINGGILSAGNYSVTTGNLGTQNGTVFRRVFLNGGTYRASATTNDNAPSATNVGIAYIVGLAGGTLDVASAQTLTLDDGSGAGTAATNAELQGAGNLFKTGTGTLVLGNGTSNFSAFTGRIFLNAGVINLGSGTFQLGDAVGDTVVASGAALDGRGNGSTEILTLNGSGVGGTGALLNSNTGTSTFSGAVTLASATSIGGSAGLTISGAISGANALTKVGTGTATLSGVNTYTGGTTVTGGMVTFNSFTSMPSTGAIAIGSAGAAAFNNFTTANIASALALTTAGSSGSFVLSGTSATADVNFTGFLGLYLGALGAVNYTGTFTPANTTTVRLGGGTGTLTMNQNLTASTLLDVSGVLGGTTILGGTNTFAAINVTNANILSYGTEANIGGTTTPITFGGGGVQITGTAVNSLTSHPVTFTVNQNFSLDIAAAGNTFTLDKPLILGTGTFTKAGAGTAILTTANNYSGATTVSGGTLRLANALALPANALTLSGTASLDLFGNSLSVPTLADAATTSIVDTGTGTGTDTLNLTAQTASVNSLISDGTTRTVALTITNPNSSPSMLNAGNTFAGGLTLLNNANGTRLAIGTAVVTTGTPGAITASPFGTGAITVGLAPADRAGIYFTIGTTLANALVFNTALGTDRVGIRTDVAGVVLSGTLTANLAPVTFSTNTAVGAVNITGQITGAQGLVLDGQFGTGLTVTLTNAGTANNYQGNTVIGANAAALTGTFALNLGAANQLPNGLTAGNVVLNSSATVTSRVNLNGFSETINGLASTGTGTTAIVDGVSGTPTLTLGDGNATGTNFAGIIRNTAGTLSINKIGTGTQTFSGVNTYIGSTTVTAGQLAITAANGIGTSSSLTVASGATFSYTPTVATAMTLAAGSTLSFGNATTYASNFGSTLTSAGAASATGTVNLNIGGAFISGTTYNVLAGGAGSSLDAATYTVLNPTNYTFTTTVAPGLVQITPTTATALTTAFWIGGLSGSETIWAASNGSTTSNWTTNGTGTASAVVPGAAATVTFSDTGASPANQVGTTLGASMSVGSITFNSTNPVSLLAGDGVQTLTIATAAGITLSAASSTVSLNAPMILGAAQTWTNSASSALTVGGTVTTNGNTLTLTGAGTGGTTISGSIIGTGGIIKSGTGTATLSGVNTYTGATTLGDATAATNTSLVISADQGTLGTLAFGLVAAPTVATGTGSLTVGTATFGALNVTTFSNTANTITIGSGKTLTVTGGLTVGVNENTVLSSKATRLTVTGGNFTILGSNVQVGVSQTTANAANTSVGTLDVTGVSSFTATVTNFNLGLGNTNQGIVNLSNTANSITAALVTVGDSAANNGAGQSVLTLGTGTNILRANTFTIGASKIGGTIQFASQTAGSPGSVVITNTLGTGGAAINVGFSNTTTGAVFTSILDLRGHTATVLASTLTIGNTAIASNGTASGTVSFDAGTFTAGAVNIGARSAAVTAASTNTATLNVGGGTFTVNGATNLGTHTATGAFASTLTDTLNLTGGTFTTVTVVGANKSGATNTGTASGIINVSGGAFNVTGTSFVLATQSNAGSAVGTLNITGGVVTTASDITDGGGTTTTTVNLNGGTLNLTGRSIGSATTSVDVVTLAAGTLQNVGQINNGAAISKTTSGVLTLSGTNTYTGATTLSVGTLNLNSTTALGTGNFVITGGTTIDNTSGGAITLANNNTQSWNGDFTFTGTNDLNLGTGAVTLSANRQVTTTAGNLTVGGAIGGGFGLTKAGNGTLTLGGTNGYTGTTTVSAGRLDVLGSTAASSVVTVASGATLGGTGTVNGTTTVNGTLASGTASTIGTLNVNGSTLTVNNIHAVRIASTSSYDRVSVTGAATLGAGSTLSLNTTGYTPVGANEMFFILTGSTAPVGAYSGYAQDGAVTSEINGSGFYLAISYTGNFGSMALTGGNDVVLYSTPTPEPTTVLLVCAAGAFGYRRIRRQKNA